MKPHLHNLGVTLQVLAASSNEATVPVLLAALASDHYRVRDCVLPILLLRRSTEAENAILLRWLSLSDHWKQLVIRREDWLSPAIRRALLGDDVPLASVACTAAAELGDHDLIPNLVAVACSKGNAASEQAALALLVLSERLAEEVSGPRDYRLRRDAQLQRTHVLGSLEKGVQSFIQHQRRELIESLLSLASRDNAVISQVLQDPADRAFSPMMELLIHSPRPCVVRLLLSYLDDPFAPLPALHALGRRRDITWLRQLCRKIGNEPSAVVRTNLKRIENIPWLKAQRFLLEALHESEQPGAVRLITLSGLPRQEALESLSHILRTGKTQGRRAASTALAEFGGAEANAIVLDALEDEDPDVRANLALQLRTRGIPGSMNRLVTMLDSPHEVERQAASKSLEEFTFSSYAANFNYLDEESRERSGQLVRRIDPNSASLLKEELCAASRTRRRRGLEMALHMGLVTELQDVIAALTRDEDQYIRLEAVRLLGICPTDISGQVLREALSDSRILVQEAAERGLHDLTLKDGLDVTPRFQSDFEFHPDSHSSVTI
ncbi:MAG: HEAT repeat domain-containing protein [Pirellulaceae bacterium]